MLCACGGRVGAPTRIGRARFKDLPGRGWRGRGHPVGMGARRSGRAIGSIVAPGCLPSARVGAHRPNFGVRSAAAPAPVRPPGAALEDGNAEPDSPEIGYRLALGWIKAGQKSRARRELQRILLTESGVPNQNEALELLKRLRKWSPSGGDQASRGGATAANIGGRSVTGPVRAHDAVM